MIRVYEKGRRVFFEGGEGKREKGDFLKKREKRKKKEIDYFTGEWGVYVRLT